MLQDRYDVLNQISILLSLEIADSVPSLIVTGLLFGAAFLDLMVILCFVLCCGGIAT
jgi:hypothetical protein